MSSLFSNRVKIIGIGIILIIITAGFFIIIPLLTPGDANIMDILVPEEEQEISPTLDLDYTNFLLPFSGGVATQSPGSTTVTAAINNNLNVAQIQSPDGIPLRVHLTGGVATKGRIKFTANALDTSIYNAWNQIRFGGGSSGLDQLRIMFQSGNINIRSYATDGYTSLSIVPIRDNTDTELIEFDLNWDGLDYNLTINSETVIQGVFKQSSTNQGKIDVVHFFGNVQIHDFLFWKQ